jgi:hypothetical protein
MPQSTTSNTAHQQQHQALMVNYINKEPFNEDVELEECSLYGGSDMKWRNQVFDKYRQIIEDVKKLQTKPNENVTTTQ